MHVVNYTVALYGLDIWLILVLVLSGFVFNKEIDVCVQYGFLLQQRNGIFQNRLEWNVLNLFESCVFVTIEQHLHNAIMSFYWSWKRFGVAYIYVYRNIDIYMWSLHLL